MLCSRNQTRPLGESNFDVGERIDGIHRGEENEALNIGADPYTVFKPNELGNFEPQTKQEQPGEHGAGFCSKLTAQRNFSH